MREIADEIAKLPISEEWIKRFTYFCFHRSWSKLNHIQQSQMINIAQTNSRAVVNLMEEHYKRVGLAKLEYISTKFTKEVWRDVARMYILEHGAKKGQKYIDILAAAEQDNKLA